MRALDMLIRFNKSKDPARMGGLTIVRDDGTSEYQPIPYAPGFIAHDLAHYAAEVELGLADAFYSLLASGHALGALNRTDQVWTPGLPAGAMHAEFIAGQFQTELVGAPSVLPPDAATFTEQLVVSCSRAGLPPPRAFGEAELAQTRSLLRDLLRQWRAVTPGGTMELRFPRDCTSSPS